MQDVIWPSPFRYMVAFLDLIFLDLASWMPSTECAQVRHYQMLLFYTLAPVALYLGLRLAFFVEALRSLRGIERDGDFARTRATTLRHSSRKAYDLFLEILSALHSLICVRIFQTFDCDEFDHGSNGSRSYLRVDYDIDCNSATHVAYTAYAYCTVVCYCGFVPAAMLLRRRKQSRRTSHANFFSMPFRVQFWFFDVVELLYRLLMTGLLLVLFHKPKFRMIACVYVSIFQQVLVTIMQPYVNSSHNKIAIAAQFITTLTVTSAYVLDAMTGRRREAVGWMLLFSNVFVVFIAITQHRLERLVEVVNALMIQEHIDKDDFAAVWKGKNMQVLASSILRSSEQCLKMIEIDVQPDEHWSYLTKELLMLRDNHGRFVSNL
ncbi:MAG: hypothetical protein VXU42_04285, partial [Verrucomicrobiota bacterium]|nr:hypothetical protein [Verrucomicrobiota bacterium]